MEVQIKKAVRAGNSSAVILPRAWLNRKVRVELIKKSKETMLCEVIDILKDYIGLNQVIGIYLAGSYARQEEDEDSDIDILVLTDGIDREVIREGIYSILLVSRELLDQKLKIDLLPIGQMIKESVGLINSSYLEGVEIKVTKGNVKWYLDTTDEKLDMIKRVIDKMRDGKAGVSDSVAYTIVLRIRTLYIIKQLIVGKKYSKKQLMQVIKRISGGSNAYEGYLNIKNEKGEKGMISVKEAGKLYNYLKSQLVDVRKILG